MKNLDIVVAVLLIVGGLNWGLVGLFKFNLVTSLLGNDTLFSTIVYVLVGVAALYQVINLKSIQRRWNVSNA